MVKGRIVVMWDTDNRISQRYQTALQDDVTRQRYKTTLPDNIIRQRCKTTLQDNVYASTLLFDVCPVYAPILLSDVYPYSLTCTPTL